MSNDNQNKTRLINIDDSDFKFYNTLKDTIPYFDNNLHLFTCAVLIGKFVVGKSLSIKKVKSYIRPEHNSQYDNLVILKCLVISELGDVSVLSNEDKLYSICESYARVGIKQIYDWYSDNSFEFETILAEKLLESFKNVDLDYFTN